MPQIRNEAPVGDLDVPLLRRIVKAGEVVDVTFDQALVLLEQEIWAAVDEDALRIQDAVDLAWQAQELDEAEAANGGEPE